MKNIILKSLIVIIVFAFIIVAFILVDHFIETRYINGVNWNVDNETFESENVVFYNEEILRLMNKYSLDCTLHTEKNYNENGKLIYDFYLYCEDYTIVINMVNGYELGFYKIAVYYYNDNRLNNNYNDIQPVVDFANEITNIIAYDTKMNENQFEKLYYDALNSEKKYATNYYHFDNIVGNVGYKVDVRENTGSLSSGYYYMLQKEHVAKSCYVFEFDGVLKQLITE